MNTFKEGYKDALCYCVYNGPPNTIYANYTDSLDTENDLIKAVKKCDRLYYYIINPSENVTCAYIENNGTLFLPKDLKITKKIARSIIINKEEKFKDCENLFNDDELIEMTYYNPHILKYVKKQNYTICFNVMNILIDKYNSELYSELFYAGSGLWKKSLPSNFVTYFNLECLNDDEIIKLYNIAFNNNNNCIEYMIPKYVSHDNIINYLKRNPDYIKKFKGNVEYNITKEQLKNIYDEIFKYSFFNFKYIDGEYQTEEMINKIRDKNYISLYEYINNKDEIGQELYMESFEKSVNNIIYIPNKYKTDIMCKKAFEHNYNNIVSIPEEFQTVEMCKKATMMNVKLIKYCKYIDYDMIENVHKQFKNDPKKNRYDFINDFSENVLIKIIKANPNLLRVLDKNKKTDKIIRTALENNGYSIQYVENQTDEYKKIALDNQPNAKKYFK